MLLRALLLLPLVLPTAALAQVASAPDSLNPTMRAVFLANRPKNMAEEDWLRMMERPVATQAYPLRIDQVQLDTLDASQLDPRYQYMLVPLGPTGSTPVAPLPQRPDGTR